MNHNPTLLNIFVSMAKTVDWNGNKVATGIFKTPVKGKVRARTLNLDGDQQADLTVHGGPDKAVYAYPVEQYEYWKSEVPDREFEWGSFGENLTTSGLTEDSVYIGDRFRIGTALFAVTQPRMPCFKLGIRLGDPTMVRRFYKSGRWGFYLKVLEEGEIETGDKIVPDGRDENSVTLKEVAQCFLSPEPDPALLAKIMLSQLAQQMKDQLEYHFERRRD